MTKNNKNYLMSFNVIKRSAVIYVTQTLKITQ